MRKSRRRRKYDYGDMFTKPVANGGVAGSFAGDSFANGAALPSAASPYYSPDNLNTIVKPVDTSPRMSADQKGSLIGAAGQLVGSAIESKQKFKETEFTEDLQKSRKEAKAALYGIGTAAAAVNPIVGGAIIAGTAIGSAIGSQTQGEWGQYKSRSGNAIDEMVNPVTGYQGIKRALQGKQTASGVVNKLTLGLFGKSDNQKDAEKGKRSYEAKRIRNIKERSQQTLANYNTSGVSDYNTMLAMGGFLPKYTKRGKRRYYDGGMVGKPQPKTTTDPLEDEAEDISGQSASPYYSPENLNAIASTISAIKPQPQANPPPEKQGNNKEGWIKATGIAANVAADFIPTYNNPNQTATEKATDQAGTQIASAIGPWWGALAKIGTKTSGQIRGDDTGSHAKGFIGDTVNPFHQFTSFQEGKGSEKTAAFLNPVAASHMAAKRRKEAALSRKRLEMVERQKAGQQKLANYNMDGNIYAKYGTQFPMGGDLPTPTDQGSGEQLASNMAQYHGPSHANGGIELDTDQNAQSDIEVEGTEVIKDNMVFSNRLRPSKDVKNIVKSSGVGTRKGDTYATLSARIGKKKGKFEEQMNSTRVGEKNSAQIMQGRLDETANLLFMDQQVRKFKKGADGKYSKGGKFPKGGNIPPRRQGTGFIAPVGNKDAFKRDALGKNRTELEKDKSLQTLDIGRVDFEDWNQRGADNPDNPLNNPNLLSVDRTDILNRFKTDNKLFATTFARYDPGNSPEQQKLKGSWMDNDIYMDAPPQPLPEVTNTPPPTKTKLNAAYVAPQLYQYGSWKKTTKKPYGGYTGDPIPKRRGRTVQATNVTPPPVFPPAVNAPVIPNAPIAPYSTPDLTGQAPPRFNIEDEMRRVEALKVTPTYPGGGLIGPTQETPIDPRSLYGRYNPAISPQSQIPLVRGNRSKAVNMQTAILDKKVDLSQMHPDTKFVTDSAAVASKDWLMRNDPAWAETMKSVQRGPLKPIQAYGGYTSRLHKMNDALKTRAFGGYLPAFGDGDRFPKYKYREDREDATYVDPITNPLPTSLVVGTPAGLTGQMGNLVKARNTRAKQYAPIKQRGLDIGDYKGDIAAGLGTIANQIQINKLETQFNPELAATPRNPYTDRRDALTHQANEQFRTASQGIEGSDAQGNLALKANMYAKSLGNLNQQLDQEQQRDDLFGLRHADTKNRTDLINTQTKNQAKMLSMENRNQKRALTQANIDNLIKSYQGNEAVRGFTQTEHGKNLLAAIQSGDRGTSERLIASLSPKMRRQLGFEAEGGIFKKGGIYIKPKNRGKFNALKKRTGKTTAQLKHSKNPLTRKRATFAANAKKWKH